MKLRVRLCYVTKPCDIGMITFNNVLGTLKTKSGGDYWEGVGLKICLEGSYS